MGTTEHAKEHSDSPSASIDGYQLDSILRLVPPSAENDESSQRKRSKKRRKRPRSKSPCPQAPPAKKTHPSASSHASPRSPSSTPKVPAVEVEVPMSPSPIVTSKLRKAKSVKRTKPRPSVPSPQGAPATAATVADDTGVSSSEEEPQHNVLDELALDAADAETDFEKVLVDKGFFETFDYAILRVKPDGIPLHGTAWVSVLTGAAYVHGASLFANSPPILFQSPFEPLLVSPSVPQDVDTAKCMTRSFAQLPDVVDGAHVDAAHHISTRCSLRDKYENLVSSGGTHILVTEVKPICTAPPLCAELPHTQVPLDLRQTFIKSTEPINFLRLCEKVTPRYIPVPDYFIHHHTRPPQRLLILGASGAGKSTLARTLVNHYVTKMREEKTREAVVYVDVDVGAPDRGLCGAVAAHMVTEPSLARRSACRSVPFCARFFGDVTPRENPTLYSRCVKAVVERAREVSEGGEWEEDGAEGGYGMIVNAHGWTNGVGEGLLSELVEMVEPTVVAWVTGGSSSRVGSADIDGLQRVINGLGKHVSVVKVTGRSGGKSAAASRKDLPNAALDRDLTLCAYFAQCIAKGRTVRVRVSDVQVVTVGAEVDGEDVPLQALVGATVGLGWAADSGQEENNERVLEADAVEVRGFGIVRAVDESGEWLYVATPLHVNALRRCDVLVVGAGVQTANKLIAGCAKMSVVKSKKKKQLRAVPLWMTGSVDTGAVMRYRVSEMRDGVRYG